MLDASNQAIAQLVALAVHRQDRHQRAAKDFQVAALAGGERASLLGQPPFELLRRQQEIVNINVYYLKQKCCA